MTHHRIHRQPLPRTSAIHLLMLMLIGVGFSTLVGCVGSDTNRTQSAATSVERLYYPQPPGQPRLQFLTSLRQPQAWDARRQTTFRQWVVGHDSKAADAEGRFVSPYGMAVDNGRMYVCDVGGGRVHVIDLINQRYSTLTGTQISTPVNITIDQDGTRYVCDTGEDAVLVFDKQDRFVRRIIGPTGWRPMDIAIHEDHLYVADIRGGQIHVLDRQDQWVRSISERGQGPNQLHGPTNIAFSPDGRLFVTDTYQQIVKIFDTQGRYVGAVGGPGSALGRFARPKGLAIDAQGHIYVADSQWEVVQIFDPQGRLLLVFGGGGDGHSLHHMGMPAGVLVDRQIPAYFQRYIDPDFQAEYLVYVINQFGHNKIAVYAFGQHRAASTPPEVASQ